jgi:hypothetical protein
MRRKILGVPRGAFFGIMSILRLIEVTHEDWNGVRVT